MSDAHAMTCMEVWGGNQTADSGVVMAGLDAWVYSKPFAGADAGGDVYYVSSCATGRITRLLVADVSGHGSAVCDVATGLRSLMRQYVNQIEPARFVRSMNQQFAQLAKAGCFATAVVTTFFVPTGEVSVCNAGHPPPLLYRAATRRWTSIESRGPEAEDNVPLGIVDEASYHPQHERLRIGDLMICYTDSLIEAHDADGEMLGVAGLLRVANQLDASDPTQVVPRLLAAVAARAPGNLSADDVTVLLFRPNGLGARAPFGQRILAPFRLIKSMIKSLSPGGEPVPWPEFTLANLGGAILMPLSRWSRRRGAG